MNNGISATKKIYPFVEAYLLYADLVQNETLVINPVTKYSSSTQFWIEDFEGATDSVDEGNPSPASLIKETDSNGSNSYGRVLLNASQNEWNAYTNQALSFSTGSEVYLEIDYYTTNRVTTGVIAIKSDDTRETHINVSLNPQDGSSVVWKKIYIELSEIIGLSEAESFLQTFQATLDAGDTEGLIYIDNIKVVHF